MYNNIILNFLHNYHRINFGEMNYLTGKNQMEKKMSAFTFFPMYAISKAQHLAHRSQTTKSMMLVNFIT